MRAGLRWLLGVIQPAYTDFIEETFNLYFLLSRPTLPLVNQSCVNAMNSFCVVLEMLLVDKSDLIDWVLKTVVGLVVL